MTLTIESTDHILELGNLPVRAWHGTTEDGSKVVVLVAAIAVPDESEATEAFKRELLELYVEAPPPLDKPTYRCAGAFCPGYPYPASERAHPVSCAQATIDFATEKTDSTEGSNG